MASFREIQTRNVIPNWRSYNKTSQIGELDYAQSRANSVELFPIDSYIRDWQENKTISFAGDLLSAAILNGQSDKLEVLEAANFILEHRDEATSVLINTAESIVSSPIESEEKQHPSIEEKLKSIINQEETLRDKIRLLKENRDYYCYNPIAYCDLSRYYVNLGQEEKAKEMMEIALHLAPHHRYVCRSAARLFLHLKDPERAHDTIIKNPWIIKDPWLMASEIAINTLRNRSSRYIKKGIEIINSDNYSPFSISELSSAIGSLEMMNGSKKKCRAFFRKALIKPNDNSLAQAQWLLSDNQDLSFEFNDYSYLTNKFEADALTAYMQDDFHGALIAAADWIEDMPFTRRPIQFAADMSYTYLKEYTIAIDILKLGLKANPNDVGILNNLAYTMALSGDIKGAEKILRDIGRILTSSLRDDERICITATAGLIEFRKGNTEFGRQLYMAAMEEAHRSHSDGILANKAFLNLAREEIRANKDFDHSILEIVDKIPNDTRDTLQLKADIKAEINE